MPFVFHSALEKYPFPSLLSDTIRVSLVTLSSGWTPGPDSGEFLADLPAGTVVLSSSPLTGKSFAGGMFRADDVEFSTPVAAGVQIDGLLLWQDGGAAENSRMLAWLDQFTGLPFAGDGLRRLIIRWSQNGIFAPGRSA